MARTNIYLPEDLIVEVASYEAATGDEINVSAVAQEGVRRYMREMTKGSSQTPTGKYRVDITVTDIETNERVASSQGSVPNAQAYHAIIDGFSAISMAYLLGCSWGRQTAATVSEGV